MDRRQLHQRFRVPGRSDGELLRSMGLEPAGCRTQVELQGVLARRNPLDQGQPGLGIGPGGELAFVAGLEDDGDVADRRRDRVRACRPPHQLHRLHCQRQQFTLLGDGLARPDLELHRRRGSAVAFEICGRERHQQAVPPAADRRQRGKRIPEGQCRITCAGMARVAPLGWVA